MNEAQTELEYIDPALKKAGWNVIEGSKIRKQFPISQGRLMGQGRRARPLKADYVLQYKNRNLAVIEAKSAKHFYTEGVGQAKDYAERLHIRYTYATNGKRIYAIDMEEATEGEINQYPTPDELWEMCFPAPINIIQEEKASWKERLFSIPFEDRSGTWQARYYQENAITKVIEAIADGKDRILLTLATGTGKTAIAFQIAWKLFHAKWTLRRDGKRSPRILFLADRNILADQAFNSFSAFEEDALIRIAPDEIRKKGQVPKNGSIFFTIFQTFMTDARKEADIIELDTIEKAQAAEKEPKYSNRQFNFGQYPKDFFDFIIIDECHRGGANDESSWRAIMDYFSPAVQLGLTATPKRDVNKDTYEYFGKPVYVYSLKEGINDGFLSPFKVKEIQTNYDEYTFTKDDVIIEGEAEVGDTFTYKDYGRRIIIEQVEKYRVKFFLDLINQSQKSLVFCATQVHAAYIRDLINQYANSKNPDYCVRVTSNDSTIGEKNLKLFQDNERNIPTVLTTSQKLTTGVDAPELRNIILLRPVNSMVEFKQIVGRGTRLFDGKDYFTIFDFVNAHEHFNDPEWDGEPLEPTTTGGGEPGKCSVCLQHPCVCEKPESELCPVCGNDPCVCEQEPSGLTVIKLSNGKEREIDATVKTSFWSPDGKPISATEFLDQLFGDLPSLFKSEEELRKIWSLPSTRKQLLEELNERGYTNDQLRDLSTLIHGEDSDLFDVLNYVAYHKDLVPRLKRAERARIHLNNYNRNQQEFLDFVLSQYIIQGISELDDNKLPQILELKYQAIADAKAKLGDIKTIRETFIGFQEYLYDEGVA
jgi:type I restriction enzyme R subunit